jgi:hypothetical protein
VVGLLVSITCSSVGASVEPIGTDVGVKDLVVGDGVEGSIVGEENGAIELDGTDELASVGFNDVDGDEELATVGKADKDGTDELETMGIPEVDGDDEGAADGWCDCDGFNELITLGRVDG